MRPGRRNPAFFVVVIAHPDPRHVVGVVVDFPLPAMIVDTGMLTAVRVECFSVIGAVIDADAVLVDRAPACRQQLDVVISTQGHRHVPGDLDQRSVFLIGRQRFSWRHRITQTLVWPVLPHRHDPLIQQRLQLHHRPHGALLSVLAAPLHRGTHISGHMLGEQGAHRLQGALNLGFVGRGIGVRGLQTDPQRATGLPKRLRQIGFAVITHNRLRGDHRPRRRISQPLIDTGQTAMRKHRP
ncbi:Uncharacterised protein [Mycobacteroides abscessus subsp. abscessus]|nr:Uncharacterised protein [Mycobacteroides abscessus subsp. abscessus]